jgi:DDE superfamily endonuclease
MRLLNSVLAKVPKSNTSQRKFLGHLIGLLLMLPGHATFRNLSRYSSYHEKTFARQFAKPFDFVALNKAAILAVVPAAHEQALALDASFVAKSGKQPYGLDRFWNSCHGRAERGLEVSVLGWIDITYNSAYGLSVEQTPPSLEAAPEATRIDAYLAQLRRVVTQYHLHGLQYVLTDGAYSKVKFVDGVCGLNLHQIGKLRCDAHLRHLYSGPRHPGPGRPQTYDGKVDWADLSRFERVETDDEGMVLYSTVVNHVHFKRNLRVVKVVDIPAKRTALLFSTALDLSALTIYRYYKARFQLEFLFRDAKQFTGLGDCQARSKAKLQFHFDASLTAVTMAKLEVRQQRDDQTAPFSMASVKRRYFNAHLIERILSTLADGTTLDKSSPAYERLCNYGAITHMAA